MGKKPKNKRHEDVTPTTAAVADAGGVVEDAPAVEGLVGVEDAGTEKAAVADAPGLKLAGDGPDGSGAADGGGEVDVVLDAKDAKVFSAEEVGEIVRSAVGQALSQARAAWEQQRPAGRIVAAAGSATPPPTPPATPAPNGSPERAAFEKQITDRRLAVREAALMQAERLKGIKGMLPAKADEPERVLGDASLAVDESGRPVPNELEVLAGMMREVDDPGLVVKAAADRMSEVRLENDEIKHACNREFEVAQDVLHQAREVNQEWVATFDRAMERLKFLAGQRSAAESGS